MVAPLVANDYVVYAHVNPITNKIFYIGMGNTQRPFDSSKRGSHKEWFEASGIKVKILKNCLTKKEAIEYEEWFIRIYKLFNHSLINKNLGGTFGRGTSANLFNSEIKLKFEKQRQKHIHLMKTNSEYKNKIMKNLNQKISIKCLETEQIFNSIKECVIYFKFCKKAFSKALNSTGVYKNMRFVKLNRGDL